MGVRQQKRVPQRVAALRKQYGISRAELALLLGVSRMRASLLERQSHITERLDKRIRRTLYLRETRVQSALKHLKTPAERVAALEENIRQGNEVVAGCAAAGRAAKLQLKDGRMAVRLLEMKLAEEQKGLKSPPAAVGAEGTQE